MSDQTLLIEFKTGPKSDFRHTLAQLLDYGSNLWEWNTTFPRGRPAGFRERRCPTGSTENILESGAKAKIFPTRNSQIKEPVKNLADGRFDTSLLRKVYRADVDVVKYLNAKMQVCVLRCRIGQFKVRFPHPKLDGTKASPTYLGAGQSTGNFLNPSTTKHIECSARFPEAAEGLIPEKTEG
jgi:hypothetical protein